MALFTLYTTMRKDTTTTSAKSTQSFRVIEYFTCRGDSIDNDMEVTSMIFLMTFIGIPGLKPSTR